MHLNLAGGNILLSAGSNAGNVGIGTSSPTKAKLEINGVSGGGPQLNGFGFLDKTTTGNTAGSSSTGPLSIYASGRIIANDFIAFSDERIKDVQGRSDPSADLSTLLNIEITDYTYIDTVTKGTGIQKKVVAQQLESVYPQAVLQFTDTIPDIYENADAKDAWIQLATDLKVGERVRLISEKEDEVYEVLEVYNDKFRTEFVGEDGPVFVYGREVDDFRSVDYDAIAMLNVSATQELARQLVPHSSDLASLKAENRQLKARIAELEAKDAARDAQIAKIEQLLSAQ